MPIIARGYDDLGIDLLVTRLETFAAREAAISAGVNFTVDRDRRSHWDSLHGALVSLEADTDTPDPKGSSRVQGNFTRSIRAICIVPLKGEPEAAATRLAYLKEQVRAGLFAPTDLDALNPALYTLGRPTWTPHRFTEDEGHLAETLVLGYWTFDLTYPWTPETVAGTALSELHATADGWSAIYSY
jgi:hypothetical protein